MRVVRIFAALTTVVALVPAGGCGSGDTRGGARVTATEAATAPGAAAHTDPKEQLLAGVRALNSATFRLVEKTTTDRVSITMEGGFDPARRANRIRRSEAVSGKSTGTDGITIGTDVYFRFDDVAYQGVPAGKWMHVDGRRLKSLRALGVDGDDMTGKRTVAEALTTVERTAPRELRGTFDPSKAPGALPEAGGARAASWQARFDEGNRLVWMVVTLPAQGSTPALTIDSAYSAFGVPLTIERPPAGSTIDAPADLYRVLDR